MKAFFLLLALSLLSLPLRADDRIREAQEELKRQGFYYGEADGTIGAETSAAIRRFQIRNGLEVTGQLNQRTSDALDSSQTSRELDETPPVDPPAPAPSAPPPAPPARPPARSSDGPVNLRRDATVEEDDRTFLKREELRRSRPGDDRPSPRPSPSRSIPSAGLAGYFAQTPYATAPREVQEQTLRRAQALLAQRGYYRDAIDGDPGSATEEAVLTLQRSRRLPLSGRLDLATLSELRLLPGRTPVKPFQAPLSGQRVYRGVIVE